MYNVILFNLNCVFVRFFFHIFSPESQTKLNQPLAQFSYHNQSFYTMFVSDARSLFKAIYIFGMECQTTLLDPGEPMCRLPVENYVVFVVVVVGYWACWPDTGQHTSSAKISISLWK